MSHQRPALEGEPRAAAAIGTTQLSRACRTSACEPRRLLGLQAGVPMPRPGRPGSFPLRHVAECGFAEISAGGGGTAMNVAGDILHQEMPKYLLCPRRGIPNPGADRQARCLARIRRNTMFSRRQLGLASVTALATPSIIRSAAAQDGRTALELINRTPAVSLFAEIIKNHGLEEQFSTGSHGYFIPANAAVERMPALQVARYRNDKELGRQTALNHVTDFTQPIAGWAGTAWSDSFRVKTLAGQTLTISSSGMSIPRVSGHPIIYMNYRVSNGLCHAIDGVLAL
jgi:uncharacterized surface protein with fasciclin (FAS1) repeats